MPQPGHIFHQRYQLLERLGENVSQQTWLAIDLASQPQHTVVMKLLAMSPQMQWDAAKLLEREAQLLQKLNHPRIPRYGDYFLLEQLPDSRFPWFCLVQSHVPGHSLQQLLDQGHHFTEAEVEKIAIEVLSLLVYLHGSVPPILHRDLKPSNLIWGEDNHLYLIDFGSVQDQAALEGATFTIVGTYGYVPMEQFGGRAVPASDLYALGATLIHLLTGTPPADLPHQNARIQFAQQVSVDPTFVNWVNKLTEPDLADRLSTARQALDALEHRQHLSLPTVHRKPKDSQIQLKKTITQLELKIPPRGWQAISWLYWASLLGSSCFLLFQLLYYSTHTPWLLWLYLLSTVLFWLPVLLPAFSQTTIRGDRTRLTFYWKLFGFTVWKTLETAKIQPLIGIYEQEKSGVKGIVVQAGMTVLSTNAMAEVERRWVIQELKDWLHYGQPQSALAEDTPILPIQGSRIKVKESDDALVIQYPGLEKYWTLAMAPLILLGVGLLLVTSPRSLTNYSLLVSLIVPLIVATVGALLYERFFPTTLRFSRDRFVAYKSILGYTWTLFSATNTDIPELTAEIAEKTSSIFQRYLAIQTCERSHTFGLGWTKPEHHWVMQAINRWLQKTRQKT